MRTLGKMQKYFFKNLVQTLRGLQYFTLMCDNEIVNEIVGGKDSL